MKILPREKYLKKIEPFLGKQVIKVITGLRRSGKSYFLLYLKDYISQNFPNANIIYINKEYEEFFSIADFQDLLQYVRTYAVEGKQNFILIDEVQDIKQFEKALRNFIAKPGYDVICTGSNSNIFSSELATLLSGRYVEIKMYPLTYDEFLFFNSLEDSQESFRKYFTFGGLPFLMHLPFDQNVRLEYLNDVYNTVVLKDIVQRHRIKNITVLNQLIKFLAYNFTKEFSATRISNTLKSNKIEISPKAILDYLNYLEESYFITQLERYDIQGKRLFQFNKKIYFTDIGLRNSLVNFSQKDIEKILENIVLMHLLSAGYKVHYGKFSDKEIDFVAMKGNKTMYVQVAYLIASDETFDREFGNLLKIKDNYPKYVVSLTPQPLPFNGIEHLSVNEFCLNIDKL